MFDRKGMEKKLKTKSHHDSHGWSVLGRFVIDFGSLLGSKIDNKSMKNEVGKQCKKKATRTGKEAAMIS